MKFTYGLVLAGLVLSASVAMAQPPAPQPLAAAVPTEYNFKIKPADVDKIGRGLGKLPFEDVAELMQSLQQQVVAQQQQASKEPEKK